MTRDEIQAGVLARSLTSDATLAVSAINDAYREIVNQAELNVKETNLTLTAGVDTVDISTQVADYNGMHGLYYSASDGSGILEPVDLNVILQERAAFQQSARPAMYCVHSFDTLELFPAPQTTGAQIVMFYYSFATADIMANGSATPVLMPPEFHDVVELYAAQKLASRYESAGDNKGLSAGIYAEYQQRLGLLRGSQRRHQSKQPRRLRTGYPRMPRIRPATPSTDVSGRPW